MSMGSDNTDGRGRGEDDSWASNDAEQEPPTAPLDSVDDDGEVQVLSTEDSALEEAPPPPPVASKRRTSIPPPSKSYKTGSPALASNHAFRAETTKLARAKDFRTVASLIEAALDNAPWAQAEDVSMGLMLDLARLYRDRLPDRARAQQAFERVIQLRPGHEEAMKFLAELYENLGNMTALHNLYARAVDDEWNPERRIELTRNAARIALDHLKDAKAAARDWERLLELGDADGQVTVELSRVYREAGRWSDLGEFLHNRAAACTGTTRVAVLREAVEAFLAGGSEPSKPETLIQQILAESADDPVALASLSTLLANASRWEELAEVSRRPMPDVPGAARLDVLRLVADLLTRAGEHDRAAIAYERILQLAPGDKVAVQAREEHLRRVGDHQGLVAFLVARADKARQAENKAKLFARAAEVAEKNLDDPAGAAALWQRSVAASPDSAAAYEALVTLYDRLNDAKGITQALEGLARVTREPKARAKVLRRLGDHYAYRAENDAEAQRCWLEVASIVPDDLSVQRELNGIHRRRGDFAALDAALTRQLWRTSDRAMAIEISREIAQNLDDNLPQPERTVRAWTHVLDLAPDDDPALQILSDKLATRTGSTEVLGVLETRLSRATQAADREAQLAIVRQIAQHAEQRGDRVAAIAAYERLRAWAPDDPSVLDALVRLYDGQEPGAALSVLEIASAQNADPARATELLGRGLGLCPEDAHRARFLLRRRLLRLRGGEQLEKVVEAGATAGAWSEIGALYQHLSRAAATAEERRAFGLRLAELSEKQLGNPVRAYVALQSLGLAPLSDADCAELERLAEGTGRWEDLLAVLDATIGPDCDAERLHAVLLRRAEICEKRLSDPRRAFLELQRFVDARAPGPLSPQEKSILERMRALAAEHNLHQELVAVFDSLWDLASTNQERVRFAREREGILREQLGDAAAALEQSLLVLRMMPESQEAATVVLEAAEKLGRWVQALPVLEGVWRASSATPERLITLAGLYDDKCGNTQHAVELLSEAVRLDPSNADVQQALERLGDKGQHWPRVVQALRLAAARVSDTPRGLDLARKIAALYADKLQDSAASLEIHRWILQVWPDELSSLQVIITAQRAAAEHADLRTSLEQWIERNPDTSRQVESWLEIGRLCREHLADQAGALVAYSHVIEIDPANEEAAEAMRGLGDVALAPALRLKRVRVELARASGPRKIELLTQLVALEQEMGDREAAIEALREMMSLEGGREPAFEPLSKLLHEAGNWSELATLLESAAQAAAAPEDKLKALREALDQTEHHLQEPEREERLLRQILALAPEDEDASVKLARLLRNARRFEELAQDLSSRLEAGGAKLNRSAARWMRRELVRLLDLALDRSKDAETLLKAKHEGDAAAHDPDDALWLATIAARKPDHVNYLEQRRRHIPKLPKRLGALVLCHLAEYCDQYMKLKGRVLALYREARTLDPDNQLATDALRGLGRGVKTWRSTAALLPVPDEESLSNADRAAKLRKLGDAARAVDPGEAIGWYERAVAVHPDDIDSWDAIAAIQLDRKETEYAWLASVEASHAFERVTSPVQSDVAALAQRLARTSEMAYRAEHNDEARELAEIAFAVDPNVPSSAMLVADARFDAGDDTGASALYGHIIESMADSLTKEQRAHTLFRRGALALRAGDIDKAHENLRSALQLTPLMSPALDAIADLLRKQGQPANAALHLLKALLVTRDTEARGEICRRIGELFETELARPDEAGAWFESAVEAGVVDNTLKRRLLQHYRRTGRAEQALTALEDLIQATTEPSELAELWAMRGSILADKDLDAAVEALDIALSYDPGHATALSSLRAVLEKRGDYAQLADLLDARTEAGSHAERVEALRSLVRICFEMIGDNPRGEEYLLRLVELAPSRESIEELLRIVEADPARKDERLPLLGRILASGPPYCDRLIEAAKLIHETGDKHWAWAVLSSILGAAPVDAWTKQTMAELRKQFERFDSITLLKTFVIEAAGLLPEPDPFTAALSDLCSRMYTLPDESGLPAVDGRTGPGKVFERLQEGLGVAGKLLRSPENAPTLTIHQGEVPTIAIRTDQLSAPPGELAWLCTYGLMLSRKECVSLAMVPESDRRLLVQALIAASADGEQLTEDQEVAALAAKVFEKLSPDELKAWKAHLADPSKAEADTAAAFTAVERAAARVALVAAGDLRTASRAVARLTPDNRRPPGVGKLDDFESFFASIPAIGWLFEFAVSADFGRLLKASG
ncbi:MAG: hypothetical protein HY898_00560 [Deltaproteobacteria bacterium]|nr:hypothetical protein [Deltaproteobacteria bacterium]